MKSSYEAKENTMISRSSTFPIFLHSITAIHDLLMSLKKQCKHHYDLLIYKQSNPRGMWNTQDLQNTPAQEKRTRKKGKKLNRASYPISRSRHCAAIICISSQSNCKHSEIRASLTKIQASGLLLNIAISPATEFSSFYRLWFIPICFQLSLRLNQLKIFTYDPGFCT